MYHVRLWWNLFLGLSLGFLGCALFFFFLLYNSDSSKSGFSFLLYKWGQSTKFITTFILYPVIFNYSLIPFFCNFHNQRDKSELLIVFHLWPPSELRHAESVVVLGSPDVRFSLPLTVLPAQLASFRQKRAKNNGAGATKKTQKRKGQADSQNDSAAQDRHVELAPSTAKDTELSSKTNHEVYHASHTDYQSCIKKNWVLD